MRASTLRQDIEVRIHPKVQKSWWAAVLEGGAQGLVLAATIHLIKGDAITAACVALVALAWAKAADQA